MNLTLLQTAVSKMKADFELAVRRKTFNGKRYPNGRVAKEALIRSQKLILGIHEATKRSLSDELTAARRKFAVYPALGVTTPELSVCGFIKAKKQDLVVLMDADTPTAETVKDGPLTGVIDPLGREVSERALVVGVRSQMSSVANNFDTLMERAFAETLNLRLRLPRLVMGEVYVLPVVEYRNDEMLRNRIVFETEPVALAKFVRTFLGISGRAPENDSGDFYKYERSALVLVDFRETPPRVFLRGQELVDEKLIEDNSLAEQFTKLSPEGFAADLVRAHAGRHPLKGITPRCRP
jgi:hypothetical protein